MEESKNILNVLCLEDILKDAELLNEMLADAGYKVIMDIATGEKEYLSFLKSRHYDIILADYTLPGFEAPAALKLALKLQPEIPFICVSGTIGEDKAVELLKQGAADYVLKDRPGRLAFAVSRALERVEQQKEEQKAEQELIIANKELAFQNDEKEKRAAELIMANKELTFQNNEKEKRAAELIIANKELVFQNKEKEKRAAELIIANKELVFQNKEKEKRAAELIIANKELVFQNKEKEKRAAELIIAKEHAEASDRLKSAFIHNISHEVRTPLNGILGFSKLLAELDLLPEEKQQYIEYLDRSSERLIHTITDYMEISMIASGNMPVNKKKFILQNMLTKLNSEFESQCTAKKLQLRMQIPEDAESIQLHSDEKLLENTMTFLLDNAVKFTKEGSITFGYTINDDSIMFFVKDTGIGICSDAIPFVFENFRQEETAVARNYDGSGLGLSIAKGLVDLLGGNISVDTEKGTGASFFVSIPYTVGEVQLIQDKEKKKALPGLEKPVILIVEDDEINNMYLLLMLRNSKFSTISAFNGKEAVDLCHAHPEISLVLMDIKMPVMDGLEATRLIKAFRKDLPIIATTAFAMKGDEERIMEAGCDDYLPKPVSKNMLLNKLKIHGLTEEFTN